MTEAKLFELVRTEYLRIPNEYRDLTRVAAFGGFEVALTEYEKSILEDVCRIILTNFTLTDKNARH